MEIVGGVVAQEDLVDAGDGFSGQHLPLGGNAAGRGSGGRVDLLPRASAELHEGFAITSAKQLGVALGFQGGVGAADDAVFVGVHLEASFQIPGSACIEPIAATGRLRMYKTISQ